MRDSAYDSNWMQDVEKLFRALADEERLRILSLLLFNQNGACVCELVDALRIPQYQVSRQLGALRDAGLVAGEKRGTWVYYSIATGLPPLSGAIVDDLMAHLESAGLAEDRNRFVKRLHLRDGGVCTVGYEPDLPFREIIPVRDIKSLEGGTSIGQS